MNSIDFGGLRSEVKATMGIIYKCGVRGDATLCVVIFCFSSRWIESARKCTSLNFLVNYSKYEVCFSDVRWMCTEGREWLWPSPLMAANSFLLWSGCRVLVCMDFNENWRNCCTTNLDVHVGRTFIINVQQILRKLWFLTLQIFTHFSLSSELLLHFYIWMKLGRSVQQILQEFWVLVRRDESRENYCHSPGIVVVSKPGRMSVELMSYPWRRRPRVCVNTNFNLGHTFLTRSDEGFHIAHVYFLWQDLSHGTIFFYPWPWPWTLTYFWKTLTLAITFLWEVIGLSYCTCVFLVARPFTW